MAGKNLRLLAVIALLSTSGCATVPYHYGKHLEKEGIYFLPPGEPQIERGEPDEFLDTAGWVWGIPSKIILWNRKVDNHNISQETEDALRIYLAKNDLHNVKVRLNQYDPGGEWARVFKNKLIHPGWRYSLGVLSATFYTLLPGRFFGGDNYNPYSNTINLYSDVPAIALHEGGHAKDFARRENKGTYAAIYLIPFVALYHEAKASNDAISAICVWKVSWTNKRVDTRSCTRLTVRM